MLLDKNLLFEIYKFLSVKELFPLQRIKLFPTWTLKNIITNRYKNKEDIFYIVGLMIKQEIPPLEFYSFMKKRRIYTGTKIFVFHESNIVQFCKINKKESLLLTIILQLFSKQCHLFNFELFKLMVEYKFMTTLHLFLDQMKKHTDIYTYYIQIFDWICQNTTIPFTDYDMFLLDTVKPFLNIHTFYKAKIHWTEKQIYIFFHGYQLYVTDKNLLENKFKNMNFKYCSIYGCNSCNYNTFLFYNPENEKEYCNYINHLMKETCTNCQNLKAKFFCS